MQHNKKFAIALDIGGSAIKYGLLSSVGKLTNVGNISTRDARTPKDLVDRAGEAVEVLVSAAGGRKNILGVGVGSPGPLNPKKGIIYFTPNLPIKKPFNFAAALKKRSGFNVLLQNDANVACLGEVWQGAAKNSKVAVLLTLGTGIGGGVVIDGKIFDGAHGQGAELGHFPHDAGVISLPQKIRKKFSKCNAGHPGCIEPQISRIEMTEEGKIIFGKSAKIYDALDVHKKAEAGDKRALKFFNAYGTRLGVLVAYLLNVFNPDVFILGGAMSGSFRFFEKAMRAEAKKRAFKSILRDAKIIRAKLGNSAGVYGAGKLVVDNFFKKA